MDPALAAKYAENMSALVEPKWVAILVLFIFSTRIHRWVKRRLGGSGVDRRLAALLSLGIIAVLWLVAAEWVVSALQIATISLTLGGVVALAVLGLSQSASRLAGDVMACVFLRADPHVKRGSRMRVGTVEGTLIAVELRHVRLRDSRGDMHVIPLRRLDEDGYVVRGEASSGRRRHSA